MKKKLIYVVATVLLVVFLAVTFTACIPKSADKAKAKLEKSGYTVEINDGSDDFVGADKMLFASKEITRKDAKVEIYLMVVYFDSVDNAKACEKELEKNVDDLRETYGEFTCWGRTNNVVFVGDKDGVKALR